MKSVFDRLFEKETSKSCEAGCLPLIDFSFFDHGHEHVFRCNSWVTLIPSDDFLVVFQRSSHEAPEGEDLDAPRGHICQRFPICACQSRVSGRVIKVCS